jgi:very-short-patch-repair endonuclease
LTDAERIIWNPVRARRLLGADFRPQTPIGPYVVDFACHDANLIVEVDGGQHFDSAQHARDARRTTYLRSKGYRVIRFNNYEVLINRQGVLETIAAQVEHALSPPLSRKRGREQAESSLTRAPSTARERRP